MERIEIRTISDFPNQRVVARVWLGPDGTVRCDCEALYDEWAQTGVLGRAANGPMFPKDGRAFLEELLFAFRSPYFCAVATNPLGG